MREYLISKPGTLKHPSFSPAHLTYKISDGRLLRKQIPVTLKGGIMVIDALTSSFDFSLIKRILAECLRFSFEGVLLFLPPIPDDNSTAFAKELLSALTEKSIPLFLPLTYSDCTGAYFLVPAICTSSSFKNYLSEICSRLDPIFLALQLTLQPIEIKLNSNDFNFGTPLNADTLKNLLETSGAMTFYSGDLCSNYFTYDKRFIVFDTPETLVIKRNIAEELGFSSCFYLISPKNKYALEKLEAII